MLLSDTYRLLGPDERILDGDQFKMAGLPDSLWSPVEKFAGQRVRDLSGQAGRVEFRRLIARAVVT